VHASGRDLDPLYDEADAVAVVLRPHDYLGFAMPVKLFEAMAYGLPVVASAGTEAQSVTGFSWSSHNLYLQTTLQVGFVGLAALFVLLWVVWRQLWHRRRTPFARVAGAFLVGTLVHQMFEVSLTQVNLANGFLVWLVLAIGSSRAEAT